MSDIDLTEAYDAASEVVRRNARVRTHETVIDAAVVPNILGAYHAAAAPLIEKAVREQVARDIEHQGTHAIGYSDTSAFDTAARIARGES